MHLNHLRGYLDSPCGSLGMNWINVAGPVFGSLYLSTRSHGFSRGRVQSSVTETVRAEGVVDAERDLVEHCCRGDTAAWEEFVRLHGPAIRAAARQAFLRMRCPGTDHDVENIAQDVFTALCEDDRRRLRGFQGRCSLAGWLRAVATNHALNHVRAERVRRARSLESEPMLVPEAPAPERADAEEVRRLAHLVERLPARERFALRLHYVDGVPQRQIAVILGVSENTIWPMISRARQKLKELMHGGA